MFIKFTGEVVVFWDFCETKGVLIWSPLPRRGAELLMFYVSTFRCQICCILLQVMATNVMGPALLTKACFFFDGLKTDWKKAWENSLMAASWWILGMFNKIKQRMDEILTPSAFFCRIDLRMLTVNLWRNGETGNRRCTHSYELLQRKNRVRCSCQCVFRRIWTCVTV